jgi:hypothetical protein
MGIIALDLGIRGAAAGLFLMIMFVILIRTRPLTTIKLLGVAMAAQAPCDVRQLPVSGALQLPRHGAEWPAHAARGTARAASGRRFGRDVKRRLARLARFRQLR